MTQRKTRELKYDVQIANIKLLSNRRGGKEAYVDIISKIHDQKISIPVYGDTHLILRTQFHDVVKIENNNIEIQYGSISSYTVIDGNDWLNLNNMEVENIDLPKNVFPSLKESQYIFIPTAHRLAIVKGDGISIKRVEKFLKEAIEQVIVEDEDFEVCVEQADDAFDRITMAEAVKKLFIDISYSNADTGDDAYAFMDQQIRVSEMKRLKMEATPNHNGDIRTDSLLVSGALKVAQSNGSAKATIIENGQRTKINTKEHPRTLFLQCEETLLKLQVVKQITDVQVRSTIC
ncbi:protein of unknown function [Segatella oulorum]|uniref:DUF4747 domain-containing protein n=1 Tax=Segatella oulorum TaxID=28136 RepID=A0A1T4P3F0_9BACT|nr:DUF4747 family protein [Segatella oulorum]SJZ86065.1 protein of unknown function [Segatella oulorum]